MKDILKDIDEWTARGDKVAIAMVVSVKRSAPRPPGALVPGLTVPVLA